MLSNFQHKLIALCLHTAKIHFLFIKSDDNPCMLLLSLVHGCTLGTYLCMSIGTIGTHFCRGILSVRTCSMAYSLYALLHLHSSLHTLMHRHALSMHLCLGIAFSTHLNMGILLVCTSAWAQLALGMHLCLGVLSVCTCA